MESFDDYLNEQLLNELGAGVAGSIGRNLQGKIGAAPEKIMAKLGSKTAKGKLNLRKEMKDLEGSFKMWCGEQSIKPARAKIEDFVDFLKHHVGFNFPDDMFDKMVYGFSEKDASAVDDINSAAEHISQRLEANEMADDGFEYLQLIASRGGANGAMARKALWQLANRFPNSIRKFGEAADYAGTPIGERFSLLIKTFAQLILKKRGSSSRSGGLGNGGSGGEGGAEIDVNELDVGPETEGFNTALLTREKYNHRPLEAQLALYGIADKKELYNLVKRASSVPVSEMESVAKQLDRRFGAKNTINICRILFQCFRGANAVHLNDLFEAYKGDPTFVTKMQSLINVPPTRKRDDDDGTVRYFYDGTAFNKAIYAGVKKERATARMMVCLLRCLSNIMPA